MTAPLRVVVADDSPFVCRLLSSYLQSSEELHVSGVAHNGPDCVELVRRLRPDVVTLDLEMPHENGLETLRKIMEQHPTPVIIVSGVSREAAVITLKALELGAVDFILKYTPGVTTDPESLRQDIVAKAIAAARTKIEPLAISEKAALAPAAPIAEGESALVDAGVVVIGASTGGPLALRELLSKLPTSFAAAIVVVQHMPANFTHVLAKQLDKYVALPVKEAEHGEPLRGGVVLVAPGDRHLLIRPDSRIEISAGPRINGHRPSIDVTMQSAAQTYGKYTMGVLLSGMGGDGATGLATIRVKSGRTFAQELSTCVVPSMPDRAIQRGVVDRVAPPAKLAQLLQIYARKRSERPGAKQP